MDAKTTVTNASQSNDASSYDSGLIQPDLDFASQSILDAHRQHHVLHDHFELTHLQQHMIQFKRPRINGNSPTDKDSADSSSNATEPSSSTPSSSSSCASLLKFDCDFESGNIGEVRHYKNNEYDMTIRGDTNNPRHCVWFYFRVRGGKRGEKLVCHISNYSKNKALYSDGFTPIIRSKHKPIWTRLPSANVNWFKCNRHRRNCLTFSFVFDENESEYFFAYSYPYTYSYLQKFLSDIEALRLPYCKRELLARSVQQRRLDCLKIQQSRDEDDDGDEEEDAFADRPCIVLSARVHPGETPSSYVMHGIIEFLLSNHESAVYLRKKLTIFVIPMLNPDGVFIGNYRATSLGFDLNRHWQKPDFMRHPTICALKYFLRQLDADKKLDFYMDLHGHTNATDGFMYCNQAQPTHTEIHQWMRTKHEKENEENINNGNHEELHRKQQPEVAAEIDSALLLKLDDGQKMNKYYKRNNFTTIFPRLLDLHCDEYSFSKTKFCNNPKKAGSARRAMEAILSDIPVCYTFEVSFWKSSMKANNSGNGSGNGASVDNLYTKETYRNLGRCMVRALCDMYRVPKSKRHDVDEYHVRCKRLMKGDLRRKLPKSKQIDSAQSATNKINVSIPTVHTTI